jgi:beta-N-acetylhexosaminidase
VTRPAPRAAIVGIAGPRLTPAEAALFRATPPLGAILFRRNVQDPAQLRALAAALREELGAEAPILVDQEGGRVARLRPPHWPAHPPAAALEGLPADIAFAQGALIGRDCVAMGLDVVCAPVLDLRLPETHTAIGDRALSPDPAEVARLGAAWAAGLQAAGAVPVIKHVPGHGRSVADTHLVLPRLAAPAALLAQDIAPFRALAGSGAWAMTAHLIYDSWDPDRPATLSPLVVERVIRGEIGFDGVLVSDDIAMGALAGWAGDVVAATLAAGCDLVLHCTGRIEESAAVLAGCPVLPERTRRRRDAAREAVAAARRPLDAAALRARRDGALRPTVALASPDPTTFGPGREGA